MQGYDFLMIAILVGTTLFGASKGAVWQIASLASIFASYAVAYHLRGPVSQMISAQPPWNMFLAMLVMYLATSLIIWFLFRMISEFIDRLQLREFDHQLGALFGAAKGVLLCVIVTLFAIALSGEETKRGIIQSKSGYYLAQVLDQADAIMPHEVHDVLHPYLHALDERLPDGGKQRMEEELRRQQPGAAPAINPATGQPYPNLSPSGPQAPPPSNPFNFSGNPPQPNPSLKPQSADKDEWSNFR